MSSDASFQRGYLNSPHGFFPPLYLEDEFANRPGKNKYNFRAYWGEAEVFVVSKLKGCISHTKIKSQVEKAMALDSNQADEYKKAFFQSALKVLENLAAREFFDYLPHEKVLEKYMSFDEVDFAARIEILKKYQNEDLVTRSCRDEIVEAQLAAAPPLTQNGRKMLTRLRKLILQFEGSDELTTAMSYHMTMLPVEKPIEIPKDFPKFSVQKYGSPLRHTNASQVIYPTPYHRVAPRPSSPTGKPGGTNKSHDNKSASSNGSSASSQFDYFENSTSNGETSRIPKRVVGHRAKPKKTNEQLQLLEEATANRLEFRREDATYPHPTMPIFKAIHPKNMDKLNIRKRERTASPKSYIEPKKKPRLTYEPTHRAQSTLVQNELPTQEIDYKVRPDFSSDVLMPSIEKDDEPCENRLCHALTFRKRKL